MGFQPASLIEWATLRNRLLRQSVLVLIAAAIVLTYHRLLRYLDFLPFKARTEGFRGPTGARRWRPVIPGVAINQSTDRAPLVPGWEGDPTHRLS